MTATDLEGLSRDDLVALVLRHARENERQARQIEELQAENRRILALLEKSHRAGKRQAAPFSKGSPKAKPRRPGRKSGEAHGRNDFRAPPDAIDEEHDAPLPAGCPDCGDVIEEERVEEQFQTDVVPVQPVRRRFRVHVGRCRGCRQRVQGRHALQTSDALGAAASQLGPHALAVAAYLRGETGASFGKVQDFLRKVFGIDVSRGGVALALQRLARRAEPTYEGLIEVIRRSPTVYSDETGARMNGVPWWLWVFATPDATVYAQRPTRGFEVIDEILGADFDGMIGHDGYAPYDGLLHALHQQCLAHPLARIKRMLEVAPRGARAFLLSVKHLFQDALSLRDRFLAGEVSGHGLAVARGRLGGRQHDILSRGLRYGPSRTLRKHLRKHHNEWLTFLWYPREIEATNWRGEQGVRPGVRFRKMSGGHRSERGARSHDILTSVLRTCRLQDADALDLFVRILCAVTPRAFLIPSTARLS